MSYFKSILIDFVAPIVGLVGGILGVASWKLARKIQKLTIEDVERKRSDENEENQLFDGMVKELRPVGYKVFRYEMGTCEYIIAERLVSKGRLDRHSPESYIIKVL